MCRNICYYHVAFEQPEISGETTVAEGEALYLCCDGSNSDPQPTLQWLSPAGEKISDSGQLVIINTNRTMTGVYTCVAILPNPTMSLSTTVDVNIGEDEIGFLNSYSSIFSTVDILDQTALIYTPIEAWKTNAFISCTNPHFLHPTKRDVRALFRNAMPSFFALSLVTFLNIALLYCHILSTINTLVVYCETVQST